MGLSASGWDCRNPPPLAECRPMTPNHTQSAPRLHYLTSGNPRGSAVLLLHGLTDSSFSWSRLIPYQPSEWRLIAPDQRGHGDSDRPDGGYGMDDFAGDAVRILDELGIRSAAVVGHSMGTFVARRLALLAPDRVTRLTLIASGPSARNEGTLELQRAVAALTDPVDPAFIREFQVGTIHRPVPDGFLERVISESLKVPARVFQAALDGMLEPESGTGLEDIRCPVLILWGDRDAVFPGMEAQQKLARRIPDATLKVYPEIGHSPHWEEPERVARDLIAFLAG